MTSKLSPEDQARVDAVISTGVNDIERKPFRPWFLLSIILLVLTLLSAISYFLAWQQGAV
ncbi:DUF3094 domain-containing protein [Simiduia sp. 21SJ11W-1]|uniref:DUF3094 family protein n=1 Tax=Simiduia sp. 21SJ11W-1 TaxID=2909669 RepID=UPI00209F8B7E|nr:DUF3094 family protein [Simiduia sp. 21SJ11W-1]UTA47535.1 DUF3094 domain-containing protein [Simiduia sp. 21SJ11W-1]